MPLEIGRWLAEFPVREHCLYLNHAAVCPLPRRVTEAMRQRIAELETSGAVAWEQWRQTELKARSLAAQLTGTRAEDISLVRSTSEGLSLVAQGLEWRKGDVVLVGEEEFAANVAPWLALARRGVKVVRFPTPSGRIRPEIVTPLLKPPVRLLALSWVSFHTGWVAPVAELAEAAHREGILVVVDAIQGLGALPVNFAALGADAVAADGHKWLLGPEGLGLLITRSELRSRLHPVLAGWLNVRRKPGSLFLQELEFLPDGRRFEAGAMPTVLVAGLAAALDLLLDADPQEVHERIVRHNRTLTQMLVQAGWQVASPGAGHEASGIVAARHPFLPAEEVRRRLESRSVIVGAREGLVRFSPHFYATAGELDALRVLLARL